MGVNTTEAAVTDSGEAEIMCRKAASDSFQDRKMESICMWYMAVREAMGQVIQQGLPPLALLDSEAIY